MPRKKVSLEEREALGPGGADHDPGPNDLDVPVSSVERVASSDYMISSSAAAFCEAVLDELPQSC
ncbi:hypothetical protein T492DRAFT_876130 [Pavlovales sp. CCMP2436]|nr:hypothetical protein T492DRAFT_876130 [Pavlovales sp. CCMP2436]